MTKKAFILIIIVAAAVVFGALYIKRMETPRNPSSVLVLQERNLENEYIN